MGVRRVSVSLDDDAYEAARTSAEAEGISLSAWLSRAARSAARREDGLRAVAEFEAEYEAEFGPIPDSERLKAREALAKTDRGESVRL